MIVGLGARLNSNPMRYFMTADVTSDMRNNRVMGGAMCNSDGAFGQMAGMPTGYTHPHAWNLPHRPGKGRARDGVGVAITVTGSGAAAKGDVSVSTITFTPTGQGAAWITGAGSSVVHFTVDGSMAAVSYGVGSSAIHISPSGSGYAIVHATDSAAYLSLAANGTVRGIGWIEGTTEQTTTLTPETIAYAVWAATSGSVTRGEQLDAAGSAANPWLENLPGTYTGSQAGKIISDIQQALQGTGSEPMAIPADDASLEDKIKRLFQYFANKRIVTDTAETMYTAGDVLVSTAPITKTDTEFIKGKME